MSDDGNEWKEVNGARYWRVAGTSDSWTLWEEDSNANEETSINDSVITGNVQHNKTVIQNDSDSIIAAFLKGVNHNQENEIVSSETIPVFTEAIEIGKLKGEDTSQLTLIRDQIKGKHTTEEELVECVKISTYGINSDGTYDPYDWGSLEGGHVEGYLTVENVNEIIDQLFSLHPFSSKDDTLTFSVKPKSGEGELGLAFDYQKITVDEYTDSMHSVSKGVSHIKNYIHANKVQKKSTEIINLELKTDSFKPKGEVFTGDDFTGDDFTVIEVDEKTMGDAIVIGALKGILKGLWLPILILGFYVGEKITNILFN